MSISSIHKSCALRRSPLYPHLTPLPPELPLLPVLPIKTGTPFSQRWGQLRKGRAVFRREDRSMDKFKRRAAVVVPPSRRGISACAFRACPVRLESPCSPTARRRATRPAHYTQYSSPCTSYRQTAS